MSVQQHPALSEGEVPAAPGAWRLFGIWCLIGGQSFGGGPATLELIRREMTLKRGWLTEQEYVRFWTLCNLVPGINLIAFAILIGRKLAGWAGGLATLAGMLLPSTTITVLLTMGFVSIQNWQPFQKMLHGIIPATAGLMFVVLFNLGRPLFKESYSQGWRNLGLSTIFVASVAIMIGLLKLPVFLALVLAAVAGPLLTSARFSSVKVALPPPPIEIVASQQDEL